MKFVVEQRSLAADQVRVEIIRLQAVHDGRAFSYAAVLELQNGHTRGRVFVWLEDLAAGFGIVARDFHDVIAHAQQQRVERMTSGGQKRTAAVFLFGVPTELTVPGADAMIVIHLAIVQLPEQTLINYRLGRHKLAGKTALEADARLHSRLLDRS